MQQGDIQHAFVNCTIFKPIQHKHEYMSDIHCCTIPLYTNLFTSTTTVLTDWEKQRGFINIDTSRVLVPNAILT